MPKKYASLRERLNANSFPELIVPALGPCRIWCGKRNNAGYPVITIRTRYKSSTYPGRKIKWHLAHRVSLADALGVKPYELRYVCHECDQALCIEPAHLVNGTQKKNVRDCVARGRHVSGFKCVTGLESSTVAG